MALSWLRRLWRPYVAVEDLGSLPATAASRVELVGTVEAVESLHDPIDGQACVAIVYHAWPPSAALGMDGASAHNSRAYQINAQQARDFVLSDGTSQVLIRVDAGEDLEALHRRLLDQHGMTLRCETEVVALGERVRIWGRVEHRSAGPGARHRELPYVAIVRADKFARA